MEKSEAQRKFDKQFGLFIKQQRERRRWTQEDLAARVSNNFQNISRLERGEISPTLFWCSKLAEAFNMSLSKLVKELPK